MEWLLDYFLSPVVSSESPSLQPSASNLYDAFHILLCDKVLPKYSFGQ